MPTHSKIIHNILGADPISSAYNYAQNVDCLQAVTLITTTLGFGEFYEPIGQALNSYYKHQANNFIEIIPTYLHNISNGNSGILVFLIQPRKHYFSIYFVRINEITYFRVLQAWGNMYSLLDWINDQIDVQQNSTCINDNFIRAKQSHGGQLYLTYDELIMRFLKPLANLLNSNSAIDYKSKYDAIFGTDVTFDNLPLYFSWGPNIHIVSFKNNII